MIAMDMHHDTRRLADALKAVPIGERISLDEMSAVIGRDIRRLRYMIRKALEVANREIGAAFATERGFGYRRLTAEETPMLGETGLTKCRRTARGANKAVGHCIRNCNDISPATMRKLLAQQSNLGMIEHLSHARNLPPIPEHESRPLPVAIAAKEFLKSIGAIRD